MRIQHAVPTPSGPASGPASVYRHLLSGGPLAAQNPRWEARRAEKEADTSEGLSLTLDGPLEPLAKVAAFPSHPWSFKPKRGWAAGPWIRTQTRPCLSFTRPSSGQLPDSRMVRPMVASSGHWAPSHEGRPDKGWFHTKINSICNPVSTTKLYIPCCPGEILDPDRVTAMPVWREEGRAMVPTAHIHFPLPVSPSWVLRGPSMETAPRKGARSLHESKT